MSKTDKDRCFCTYPEYQENDGVMPRRWWVTFGSKHFPRMKYDKAYFEEKYKKKYQDRTWKKDAQKEIEEL